LSNANTVSIISETTFLAANRLTDAGKHRYTKISELGTNLENYRPNAAQNEAALI